LHASGDKDVYITEWQRFGGWKKVIRLRVLRQDKPSDQPDANRRWEEFELPWRPSMNIISCLMAVQRNPVTLMASPPMRWCGRATA
jgi:succinate dehydrogenase / fumarate reductase iron-sulfur subunit